MADFPFSCTVHRFSSKTKGLRAYESGKSGASNAILFVGGLGDGPHTVPFVQPLAKHLEAVGQDYSVFEIRMRSSFTGFGHSNLKNDVEDISELVSYLRSIGRRKVVFMGHSTGSQDCMEYASLKDNPVDGFILQGPVSDREGVVDLIGEEEIQESVELAASMVAEGRGSEFMKPDDVFSVYDPVTAYRWHSLISKGGDDDFFSSDLGEETVSKFWNRFEQPALVLYSSEDEHVPGHVNRQALVDSWKKLGKRVHPLSGLIPGASHTVKQPEAQKWMNERVVEFLTGIGDERESHL